MERYIILDGYIITSVLHTVVPPEGGIAYPYILGDVQDGDAYIDGVLYPNPAGYNAWGQERSMYSISGLDENDEPIWVVAEPDFTDFLKMRIREYRNQKLEEALPSVLIYDEGGVDEEELGLTPDKDTIDAVAWKSNGVALKTGDSIPLINFKFSSFQSKGTWDVGYREIPSGFLQQFYEVLDERNQSFRDAENYILKQHGINSWFTSQAAMTAFDDYLNNL